MVQSRWNTAAPRLSFVRAFYSPYDSEGEEPVPGMNKRGEGLDIDVRTGLKPSVLKYMDAGQPGSLSVTVFHVMSSSLSVPELKRPAGVDSMKAPFSGESTKTALLRGGTPHFEIRSHLQSD
ncbi:hypothetical protein B0H13DRAFT_1886390 [Mycena leptocephala]|nr:hypothetical protein B0H13DRAFT_1886390 [Mycena leptocephala]